MLIQLLNQLLQKNMKQNITIIMHVFFKNIIKIRKTQKKKKIQKMKQNITTFIFV